MGRVTNRTPCFCKRTGSFVWSIGASYYKLLHSDGVKDVDFQIPLPLDIISDSVVGNRVEIRISYRIVGIYELGDARA